MMVKPFLPIQLIKMIPIVSTALAVFPMCKPSFSVLPSLARSPQSLSLLLLSFNSEGEFMVACDVCDEWYHGKCVGVSEYVRVFWLTCRFSHFLAVFLCLLCSENKLLN
jgi:hypothetical protein